MKSRNLKHCCALLVLAFVGLFALGAEAALQNEESLAQPERTVQAKRGNGQAALYEANMTPEEAKHQLSSGVSNINHYLLICAKYNPHPGVITLLLKAGADVNAKDNEGLTALMLAAFYNSPGVVRTLIQSGADPNLDIVLDGKRYKALDFARANEVLVDTETFKILAAATKISSEPTNQAIALQRWRTMGQGQTGAFGPDLTRHGLLRLGTRYKDFDEVYKTATLINTGLFAIEISVFSLDNLKQALATFSFPSPVYELTIVPAGHSPSLVGARQTPAQWGLLRHYMAWLGKAEVGDFLMGLSASDIWFGNVPENFSLGTTTSGAVSYRGFDEGIGVEYSIPNSKPSSIREQEAANKRTLNDYLKMCEPYAPLVITAKTNAGELLFLQEAKNGAYRLLGCHLSQMKYLIRTDTNLHGAREWAGFILKQFGEENGIGDFYEFASGQFFWKNPSKGYAIRIGDGSVYIFPILDDHTLYPLLLSGGKPKFFDEAELRKRFKEEKPVETNSEIVRTAQGVGQEITRRYITFKEFVERELGPWNTAMGFTRFGDSLKIKH